MKKVLGIDPGETTGVALYHIESHRFEAIKELDTTQGNINMMYRYLQLSAPDGIVCERFDYRPNQKVANLRAVAVIGVIELFAEEYDVPILYQTQYKNKESTGVWVDDKLKALGLYKPSNGGHMMDAVRQILNYVTNIIDDQYWLFKYREAAR